MEPRGGQEELVSVVVPVYNERESLEELAEEILSVARSEGLKLELIFVDDGSSDGSWETIAALAARHPEVRGLRFRRNFGKAAALQAGFDAARGAQVVTLDADLQDDPAEIPRLLAKLDEGFDLVNGWKRERKDPWHKVWPSKVFNWATSAVCGVALHDHNCGLKAYRREAARALSLHGELHRFIPALLAAQGFAIAELAVHHRPRKYGKSKYGARRFVRGLLDLATVKFLTTYAWRPLHLFGGLGLSCLALGVAGAVSLAAACAAGLPQAAVWGAAVLCALFFLAALQLFALGLLAELFAARAALEKRPFSISERVGDSDKPSSGDSR